MPDRQETVADPYAEALCEAYAAEAQAPAEAERAYWRLAGRYPHRAEAWHHLGMFAHGQGNHDAAAALLRRAVELDPFAAEGHASLGAVLLALGKPADAEAVLSAAVALKPGLAPAWVTLAAAYGVGRPAEAEAACRRALAAEPGHAGAYANLVNALARQDRLSEAVAAGREGVALAPDRADLRWNLALALLKSGDWLAGWEHYECRYQLPDFQAEARNYRCPQWAGEPLDGKTILLHAEQGFGDTIQMFRYVPAVRVRGARVLLEVPPELERLATRQQNGAHVVYSAGVPPRADYHCSLMSLPRVFGITPGTVPDPANLGKRTGGAGIGYCWAGAARHLNDANRSAAREDFAPFAELPGSVPLAPGAGGPIDSCKDFADTADLIAGLSLVVSVDTAVAHLAATLGVPTIILLGTNSDWRWLTERTDTPWYPAARLYRKPAGATWKETVARVAAAMTNQSLSHRSSDNGRITKHAATA